MIARRYPMLYRGIDHPTLILARFAWDKNLIELDPPQWVRDTINDDAGMAICTDKTMLVLQMIASKAGVRPHDVQTPDRIIDRRLHMRDDLARSFRLERELQGVEPADYDPEIFWRSYVGRPRDRSTFRKRLISQAKNLPHPDLPWAMGIVQGELSILNDQTRALGRFPTPEDGWTMKRIISLIEALQLVHWHLASFQLIEQGAHIGEHQVQWTNPTAQVPSTRCLFCGRPLNSHKSKFHRAGPECIRTWAATAGRGYNEPKSADVFLHILRLERKLDYAETIRLDKRERWAGSNDLEHLPLGNLLHYANQLWSETQEMNYE